MCVADPRTDERRSGALGVMAWQDASGTVAGESLPSNGAFAVADPRPGIDRTKGDDWYGGGHFGVLPWRASSGAVSAAAGYDNGVWSVADPRLPEQSDRLVAVIRSLDGTWHRPFSTLELAALQSLVDPEEHLELEGMSDSAWRERIGNAVPPDAAQAMNASDVIDTGSLRLAAGIWPSWSAFQEFLTYHTIGSDATPRLDVTTICRDDAGSL